MSREHRTGSISPFSRLVHLVHFVVGRDPHQFRTPGCVDAREGSRAAIH